MAARARRLGASARSDHARDPSARAGGEQQLEAGREGRRRRGERAVAPERAERGVARAGRVERQGRG